MSPRLPILTRTSSDGPLDAGDELRVCVRVLGYARLVGYLESDAPPAPGYPRVLQSADAGESWTQEETLEDAERSAAQRFSFDVPIQLPWVAVTWKQGDTRAERVVGSISAVRS